MLGSLNISGIWYRYFSCERSKEEKSKEYSNTCNKSYALTLNTDISINKNNLEERKLKKKKIFAVLFIVSYSIYKVNF